MTNFPEEYLVSCKSNKQCNQVMALVYGKPDYTSSHFEYIFIKKDFDCDHLFINPRSGKPIFEFTEWLEKFSNVQKEMELW